MKILGYSDEQIKHAYERVSTVKEELQIVVEHMQVYYALEILSTDQENVEGRERLYKSAVVANELLMAVTNYEANKKFGDEHDDED